MSAVVRAETRGLFFFSFFAQPLPRRRVRGTLLEVHVIYYYAAIVLRLENVRVTDSRWRFRRTDRILDVNPGVFVRPTTMMTGDFVI